MLGYTYTMDPIEKIEAEAAEDAVMWGGSRAALLSYSDEWFNQYGVINSVVLNNTIAYLLGCGLGIKDCEFNIDPERQKINLIIYLGWWRYHFRRSAIFRALRTVLSRRFAQYDVLLSISKYQPYRYLLGGQSGQQTKKDNPQESKATSQSDIASESTTASPAVK